MTLPESTIQDAFHSYLKSSLTHAKAERLLDPALLESAEADLMVTGPALCLYFAALRCTTNPPSVPLPRSRKGGGEPIDLSPTNCPPTFIPFLTAWARLVPPIQALPPERQHDLARVICGLLPLYGQGQGVGVGETAHRLRAIALEISQRRSFQDRFAGDIQAALDGGGGGGAEKRTTSFVPPPGYDSAPPPTPPPPTSSSSSSSPEREAILTIRETLYAALGDVLSAHARVFRPLMARDPPRAYFGSVALAVLDVAVGGMVWSTSISEGGEASRLSMERGSMDGEKEGEREGRLRAIGVRTPLPHTPPLTLEACPPALQPFMRELCGVAEEWRERDDQEAVERVSTANSNSNQTTLERVVDLLVQGAYSGGRTSPEGRTLAFANRVSALALGVTRLAAFRERQDEVFGILRAVMG